MPPRRCILGKAGSLAPLALSLTSGLFASAEPTALVPGQTVERTLAGGQSHQYSVRLERGNSLRVSIDQQGIDVVTVLADSEGRERVGVDSSLGIFGRETLCFVADRSGSFRIAVSAFDPEVVPGKYSLRAVVSDPAASSDRVAAQASLVYWRATGYEKISTADSRRRALSGFEESARLWSRVGEQREQGVALYAGANVLRDGGDLRQARSKYERALDLARQGRDRQLEAKILVSLAWGYGFLGQPDSAKTLAESALALSLSIGDLQNQGDTLKAKAFSLLLLGRYQESLDSSRKALELARQLKDRPSQAWAWKGIGDADSALGDALPALRAFENANDLFRTIRGRPGLMVSLESAGFLCWQIGAYRRALSLYEESLAIAVAAGYRHGEALARNNIGLLRLTMGELGPARAELEQALRLWRSGEATHGEALSLHNLGKVDELSGGRESSGLYERALEMFRKSGDRGGEARVLASIAQAEENAGRLDRAEGRIEESLAIFDSLNRQIDTPRLRGSFLALRQNAYAVAVDILARENDAHPGEVFAAKAFQASERARARTLLESLTEARLDLASELPEEIRRRQAEISERLVALEKDLAKTSDRKTAEDRVAAAEDEWDKLIGEIRRRNPRYASLRYPEPISWEKARGLLDPETAIIAFAAVPDRILVFSLTASDIRVRSLALSPAALEVRVQNYVGLISREESHRWDAFGRQLAAWLVEPWLSELPAAVRRLVIVPDGALNSLPWESLPAGPDGHPLLDRFIVSYAPSVTVYSALQARRSARPAASPRSVFALADPPLVKAVSLAAEDSESFRLEALPFAVSEARSVVRFGGKGSQLWLGADASERRVKDSDLRRFGVLHFATHALLSDRAPARSALLLAADGRSENGLLQAREIYRLRLESDLVTLSACRTARGRILPGEGVQGLAQAFFHAGARSVVASLWDVSDRRTADLMSMFYEHLASGEPKAEALRAAKRDMLRREPRLAPRYWAAFVLMGDPAGRILLARPRSGLGWSAAGAAAGVSVGFWAFAKRRRRKISGAS